MNDTARLACALDGCANGMRVDARHLANLQAAGWICPDHPRQEPRQ